MADIGERTHAPGDPPLDDGGRLAGWYGIVFPLVTAATAILGYFTVFSIFVPWDDEGYMLVSLRAYEAGGVLYRDVFAQYGPFYYEIVGNVLRAVGHPPTMDDARFVTLVAWTGTGLLIGVTVLRLTRSLALSVAGQLLAVHVLIPLAKEPLHPQDVIALACAAMVAVAAAASRARFTRALATIGALATAALLTKVNVGGLALVALVFACVAAFSSPGPFRSLVCVGVGALPLVLMAPDLREPAYLADAAVLTLGVLALGTAARTSVSTAPTAAQMVGVSRWARPIATGAAVTALLVVGMIVLQGVTPGALIAALVLEPARQREVFAVPLQVPGWSVAVAVLSFAIACAWSVWQRARTTAGDRSRAAAIAKLAVGCALCVTLLLTEPAGLAVAVALAWYAAVPLDAGADRVDVFTRVFLGAVAVLESLQIYPVAGTQTAVALVLFVPLGAIALVDGWAVLGDVHAAFGTPAGASVRTIVVAAVALVIAAFAWLLPLREYARRYYDNVPLHVAGADRLRLPALQAQTLRSLVWMLKQQCSTFITYPGMNSFYVMTGMEPPTGFNTTAWMFQLDGVTQQRVLDAVAPIQRLCVVRNRALIDFWRMDRVVPDRPLVRYIDESFRIAWRNGDYDVLVRK